MATTYELEEPPLKDKLGFGMNPRRRKALEERFRNEPNRLWLNAHAAQSEADTLSISAVKENIEPGGTGWKNVSGILRTSVEDDRAQDEITDLILEMEADVSRLNACQKDPSKRIPERQATVGLMPKQKAMSYILQYLKD